MEHLIAILLLGLICVVWAIAQRFSGRACSTCHGCGNEAACVDTKVMKAVTTTGAGKGLEVKAAPAPALVSAPAKKSGPCWKRRLKAGAAAAVGLGLGAWGAWGLLGPTPTKDSVKLQRPLMGTVWTIEVVPGPSQDAATVRAAMDKAFEEAARIEAVMSEWKPESPISAVNASAGGEPVKVPAELKDLVVRGVEYGRRSDGAFDLTWRGMGRIWRIYDQDFTVPTPEAVAEARARVDYRKVRVEGDAVGLAEEGMAIGLGGIAKGYAVDRAVEVLQREGMKRFSVAGAGDIRVVSGGGEPWRIGVRNPRGGRDDLIAVVELRDGAVSTSGDYERFKEVDGVRYHHIVDPRTGYPAKESRSTTIVTTRAEIADALATAAFVLGGDQALALAASEPGTELLLVDSEGRVRMSPGFTTVGRLLPEAEKHLARQP